MNREQKFVFDYLLGGISAGVSKTFTAPMERVKLILQTQDTNPDILRTGRRYKGIKDCFQRLVKEQGPASLWRGNLANVIRFFPAQALNFAFKELYRGAFKPKDRHSSFSRKFLGNLAAGGCAGATSLLGVYPIDFVRTRLATDTKNRYKGMRHCFEVMVKSDGVLGLYKGFGVTLVSVFVYRAAFFGFYDTAKPLIGYNLIAKFFVANFVTSCSMLIAYPLDTIRRRLMLQAGRSRMDVQYFGGWDCVVKIWTKEGISGFYKGCLPNIFKIFGSCLLLIIYDEVYRIRRTLKKREKLVEKKLVKMVKEVEDEVREVSEELKNDQNV